MIDATTLIVSSLCKALIITRTLFMAVPSACRRSSETAGHFETAHRAVATNLLTPSCAIITDFQPDWRA